MDRNRILELAAEELERKKKAVDVEIETIRAELRGAGTARTARPVATRIAGRRPRTSAQRKAQSLRMKRYWAMKKLRAAKASPAHTKRRSKSAAEKKALSLKMKQVWAKKKAETAAKTKPTASKTSPKSTRS